MAKKNKSVIELLAEEAMRTGKEVDLSGISRPANTVYNIEQATKWFGGCHEGSVSCHKYISDYARNVKTCESLAEAKEFIKKQVYVFRKIEFQMLYIDVTDKGVNNEKALQCE